ncbi:MAPEG family protein [Sphingomonas adhaesiva]|uniref:MAPEG family protein n=1 Tax=Sphingomonas adhaesiva TaxID=28212 RepID=UPI002FF97EF4
MTPEPFRREQRHVAAAMAAALATALVVLGVALARAGVAQPFIERLRVTFHADLFVLLCLAAAIGDVARRRFLSARDIAGATAPDASADVLAARAILQNTLEQAVLATGAHLALTATFERSATPVAALAGLFVAGRVLFHAGYRQGAAARAFGFALTFYPSVLALAAALWFGV